MSSNDRNKLPEFIGLAAACIVLSACNLKLGSGRKITPTPTPAVKRYDVGEAIANGTYSELPDSEQKKGGSNLVPVNTLFPGADRRDGTPTPTFTPTMTPKPTNTPVPTPTDTPVPTPTPTPTMTPKPTNTPRPTKTPTPVPYYQGDPTPTPTPGAIDYILLTGTPAPRR